MKIKEKAMGSTFVRCVDCKLLDLIFIRCVKDINQNTFITEQNIYEKWHCNEFSPKQTTK